MRVRLYSPPVDLSTGQAAVGRTVPPISCNPVDDLEERLDALFAGPPGEFTAARTALVKDLRAAGEREEAERVGALRRPTKLAAELNRLAREEPDGLEAAIAAEEALARAQEAMLGGRAGAEELTAAAQAEGAAIAALSDDVGVRAAIRAAARREDEREEMRRGRLSHDPEPDLGAGLLGGQAPPPPRAAPARSRRRPKVEEPEPEPDDSATGDELAARRAKRAEARREAELAEARDLAAAAADNARRAGALLDEARDAREQAARARDEAEAETARVTAELAEARRAEKSRREEADVAAAAERRAEREAQEAEGLVAAAEDVVARLDRAED